MGTRSLRRAVSEYETRAEGIPVGFEAFSKWLVSAGEEELWRINAFELADRLHADRRSLLELLIRLTFEGTFELNWDFHCTECNAVAGSHHHLREATTQNHCPLCDVDFRNDLTNNVEVTFTPSPRYYRIGERFLDQQAARTRALHGEKAIRLPASYVSGIDCLHVGLFRKLFETESLSIRESMRIGQVCIMFTDIKGSTALYDRLGDTAAYGLVRFHFDILFEKVDEFGGVVVKTIGDSVMASFKSAQQGVAAAAAIQESFRELNERRALRNEILVKVGLHAGSTIMVNLNNRIDYFGQTVNLAARIQGSADGGEIVVSEAIRHDPPSLALLRSRVKSLTKRQVDLKGIRASQTLYRLNFDAPVYSRELSPAAG